MIVGIKCHLYKLFANEQSNPAILPFCSKFQEVVKKSPYTQNTNRYQGTSARVLNGRNLK